MVALSVLLTPTNQKAVSTEDWGKKIKYCPSSHATISVKLKRQILRSGSAALPQLPLCQTRRTEDFWTKCEMSFASTERIMVWWQRDEQSRKNGRKHHNPDWDYAAIATWRRASTSKGQSSERHSSWLRSDCCVLLKGNPQERQSLLLSIICL